VDVSPTSSGSKSLRLVGLISTSCDMRQQILGIFLSGDFRFVYASQVDDRAERIDQLTVFAHIEVIIRAVAINLSLLLSSLRSSR
jgi:hypothetical protein